MSHDILSGQWKMFQSRLNEIWVDLTESDLEHTKNDFQEAVGYLQKKYGETKEAVEHKLASLIEN